MTQVHTSRWGSIARLALAMGLGAVAIVAAVARFPEFADGALVVARSDASHDHRQPPVARRDGSPDLQTCDGRRDDGRCRRRAPAAWTTERVSSRNAQGQVDRVSAWLDRRREVPAALFHEANAPPGVALTPLGDHL